MVEPEGKKKLGEGDRPPALVAVVIGENLATQSRVFSQQQDFLPF